MNKKELKQLAKEIRKDVLDMLYKTKSCHLGSNMSCVEILVALYFDIMKKNDVFVSSKGHCAAALYSILERKGEFSKKEKMMYFKENNLISHTIPGVVFSGGSLGQGLSVAAGIAMANRERDVYCLLGDGELNEGNIWEAVMFATQHRLHNLKVIVDKNGLQACGETCNIMDLDEDEDLLDKWASFGWIAHFVYDGHDIKELFESMTSCTGCHSHRCSSCSTLPRVLIADTIKGKGVRFAENKVEWHYWNLTKELYEKAIKGIR